MWYLIWFLSAFLAVTLAVVTGLWYERKETAVELALQKEKTRRKK